MRHSEHQAHTFLSCFVRKICLEKFRIFAPPPFSPRARSENSIVFHAEMCFDGWVSVARRGFFSQGLFFGPMSSFPVIYSNRFGVKTLHPTRYRPPANVTAHPQKRTTMVGGPLGKATYGRENSHVYAKKCCVCVCVRVTIVSF